MWILLTKLSKQQVSKQKIKRKKKKTFNWTEWAIKMIRTKLLYTDELQINWGSKKNVYRLYLSQASNVCSVTLWFPISYSWKFKYHPNETKIFMLMVSRQTSQMLRNKFMVRKSQRKNTEKMAALKNKCNNKKDHL